MVAGVVEHLEAGVAVGVAVGVEVGELQVRVKARVEDALNLEAIVDVG
jgi:hypothetical protein